MVLPRVHQYALGGLGLLQLRVDRDERLDRRGRVRVRLDLAVVQRLGVGVALLGERAQLADVDGQRLVVVLHELGQVEQGLRHLGRGRLGVERQLERRDEGLLEAARRDVRAARQLRPARDEGRVE